MAGRIASLVGRLRRRPQVHTSPTDAFDALLAASVETGGVITVPGIAAWLGCETSTPDPDFTASIDLGLTEGYEAYCERISRTEATS
ncbi:hypothetical protein OG601_46940 [Streptomyces sp. NBC_01239]|uniref:hypothetical protein n=1 Tax=Streptomyces sp. NBC_01239 TaxID=2903792 RepID=UPI002259AF96|nr:hypothetical protein [Streptomyces sp. NBC_01239]MCX4809072.1 hypothetical protein [Streptomyces sp. NBC_01239]MCX4818111.1 hypothetical protein [Streptomyces sp. NBC_01239]